MTRLAMRMPITFVTFYMDVSQRTMDSIHATTIDHHRHRAA